MGCKCKTLQTCFAVLRRHDVHTGREAGSSAPLTGKRPAPARLTIDAAKYRNIVTATSIRGNRRVVKILRVIIALVVIHEIRRLVEGNRWCK